jgi:hypothetical protein
MGKEKNFTLIEPNDVFFLVWLRWVFHNFESQ